MKFKDSVNIFKQRNSEFHRSMKNDKNGVKCIPLKVKIQSQLVRVLHFAYILYTKSFAPSEHVAKYFCSKLYIKISSYYDFEKVQGMA